MRKLLGLVVLVSIFVSAAAADDLTPPPWERYEPGTTYQKWEFSRPDDPLAPEEVYNPYGDPFLDTTEWEWIDEFAGRTGVLAAWYFYFAIPNNPDPNLYKDIWLQYVFHIEGGRPAVEVFPEGQLLDCSLENDVGNGWFYEWWHFRLYPNPEFEEVLLYTWEDMPILLDQVVIDTICVPEPVTTTLIGLALLGFAVRRRR